MGGSITQRTEAALFSALLLLFCRNEKVFISRGGCRWHRGAFMWTDRTKRKTWRWGIKEKELRRGGRTSVLNSDVSHQFELHRFPELIPGGLKVANKRGPGNLELGTRAKGRGSPWRLPALIFEESTDQRELIGPFSLTPSIFTLNRLSSK